MDDCSTDYERAIFEVLGRVPDYPVRFYSDDKINHGRRLIRLGIRGNDYGQAMVIFEKTFGAQLCL